MGIFVGMEAGVSSHGVRKEKEGQDESLGNAGAAGHAAVACFVALKVNFPMCCAEISCLDVEVGQLFTGHPRKDIQRS